MADDLLDVPLAPRGDHQVLAERQLSSWFHLRCVRAAGSRGGEEGAQVGRTAGKGPAGVHAQHGCAEGIAEGCGGETKSDLRAMCCHVNLYLPCTCTCPVPALQGEAAAKSKAAEMSAVADKASSAADAAETAYKDATQRTFVALAVGLHTYAHAGEGLLARNHMHRNAEGVAVPDVEAGASGPPSRITGGVAAYSFL